MGLVDALAGHEAVDLSKKKILIGEAVIQVGKVEKVESKKTDPVTEYLKFPATLINVSMPQKEGSNVQAGNVFELFFAVDQDKKVKKLINNLFTAGITVDKTSEESIMAGLQGLENKLIYCYFGKGKFTPEGESEEKEYQTYRFLQEKKMKPEWMNPEVPF